MKKSFTRILSLLSLIFTSPIAMADDGKLLLVDDFTKVEASPSPEWKAVNDGVMGGLSQGQATVGESGILRFSGKLSLENNGGFSSIRREVDGGKFVGFDGIVVRVKGDGRTYDLRLITDARVRGMEVSYRASFETKKDEWIEVRIPFAKLEASVRGWKVDDRPFVAEKLQAVGFILADKKAGDFAMEVDWIKAYGSKG